MTPIAPRRGTGRRPSGLAAPVALACLAAGCALTPATHGAPPAPNVAWTPPPSEVRRQEQPPTPAPALPEDIATRIGALKLGDVLDIALRNNTQTRAAWSDARAAAANYGVAKGAYLPQVTLDGAITGVQTVPSGGRAAVRQTFYGPTVNATWLLLDFGSRGGSVAGARDALFAADWTHNAVVQDVVLNVATAYFSYLDAKALLAAQQATVAAERSNLAAAEGRHNVGLATIADVLQARTALSQAQLAVEGTEGDLATTRGSLALSMGLPANVPYDIAAAPDTTPPLGVVESLDSLIARAVRSRPDLAAARANVDAARARVRAATGEALPALVATGTGGETYFNTRPVPGPSYSLGLSVQVPIFFGFAHLYGIKAAQAEADASRARAQGLEQQVIFQVFNSYYGLRTATQRVRTAEDLFAAAQQSEQVAAGRYKEGAGTALDLLTAESALADARAQRINARFAWYIALAQLAHDVGVLGLDGSTPFALQPDTTGTPQ